MPTKTRMSLRQLHSRLGELPKEMRKEATTELEMLGERLASKVRNRIRSGRVGGKPLAPETVARKGHSKKLIDEGDYAESFAVVLLPSPRGVSLAIGPKKGSGYDEAFIKSHEFGSIHVPKRPHIVPAMRELRRTKIFTEFLKGSYLHFSKARSRR